MPKTVNYSQNSAKNYYKDKVKYAEFKNNVFKAEQCLLDYLLTLLSLIIYKMIKHIKWEETKIIIELKAIVKTNQQCVGTNVHIRKIE